jgi:hypothetical protein
MSPATNNERPVEALPIRLTDWMTKSGKGTSASTSTMPMKGAQMRGSQTALRKVFPRTAPPPCIFSALPMSSNIDVRGVVISVGTTLAIRIGNRLAGPNS